MSGRRKGCSTGKPASCRYQLTLNGRRPLLLGSAVQDDNVLLSVDLTNPDTPGRRGLRKDSIHVLQSTVPASRPMG